jgi:hypothetical protein
LVSPRHSELQHGTWHASSPDAHTAPSLVMAASVASPASVAPGHATGAQVAPQATHTKLASVWTPNSLESTGVAQAGQGHICAHPHGPLQLGAVLNTAVVVDALEALPDA